MDNYLTILYFEKFKITEYEKELMQNNTYEDSETGRLLNVRNDQSIHDIRMQQDMITMLITKYIEKLKNECK